MYRKLFIFIVFVVLIGTSLFVEARKYSACTAGCHKCRMTVRQWEREMDEIDWALHQLRNMQLRYRSQSLIHLDQGIRWQFIDGQFTESRRALAEADLEQKLTHVIQRKINYLENRREFLLKCHI